MLKKARFSIKWGLFVIFAIICVLLCAENLPAEQNTPANISINLKDADMSSVLRLIALKANVNIVSGADVSGSVTVRLTDVPWEKALDIILKTYGYSWERQGNVITVTTVDKLMAQKESENKLSQLQPLVTEVFILKYVDADDLKETLKPQLSSRGTITALKMTAEAGWQFSTSSKGESLKKLERQQKAASARSKTLIISDIPAYIEKIKQVISVLDVAPMQVLIEARIVEVNEDTLRDIGFDWGTGSGGAESSTITTTSVGKNNAGGITDAVGGHILGSQVTPSVFEPKATSITAANTGFKFIYQKLTGTQFEAVLHALEEDVHANTLSAPRIMTLNNQEATILVGTKYPILTSEVSSQAGTTVTSTLDYYQDIGIQLNVVPQISGDRFINMVIHPAVTSYDSTNTVGTNKYPVISTREAETRVLLEDSQTIVIGGLLKDVKKKGNTGVPFLKDLPILGGLFSRDTNDVEKIDLLIFITAKIINPQQLNQGQLQESNDLMSCYQLEQEMIRRRLQDQAFQAKKRSAAPRRR